MQSESSECAVDGMLAALITEFNEALAAERRADRTLDRAEAAVIKDAPFPEILLISTDPVQRYNPDRDARAFLPDFWKRIMRHTGCGAGQVDDHARRIYDEWHGRRELALKLHRLEARRASQLTAEDRVHDAKDAVLAFEPRTTIDLLEQMRVELYMLKRCDWCDEHTESLERYARRLEIVTGSLAYPADTNARKSRAPAFA